MDRSTLLWEEEHFCPKFKTICIRCGMSNGEKYCGKGIANKKDKTLINKISEMEFCPLIGKKNGN